MSQSFDLNLWYSNFSSLDLHATIDGPKGSDPWDTRRVWEKWATTILLCALRFGVNGHTPPWTHFLRKVCPKVDRTWNATASTILSFGAIQLGGQPLNHVVFGDVS